MKSQEGREKNPMAWALRKNSSLTYTYNIYTYVYVYIYISTHIIFCGAKIATAWLKQSPVKPHLQLCQKSLICDFCPNQK